MPRNPIRLFDNLRRPVYFDVHFEKKVGQHTLLLVAPRDNPREGGIVVAEVIMPNGMTDYHIVRDDDVVNFVFEAYKESRRAPAPTPSFGYGAPSSSRPSTQQPRNPWDRAPTSASSYANMNPFKSPSPNPSPTNVGGGSGTSYWNKRLNTTHYPYAMTPPPELIDLGFKSSFTLNDGTGKPILFRHVGDIRYRGFDYMIANNTVEMPGHPAWGTIVILSRGGSLSYVNDFKFSQQIVRAFKELKQNGSGDADVFDDDPVRADEYEAGFAKTLFFSGNDGKDYPFKRLAAVNFGGHEYFLLAPDFAIPGQDANEALVYRSEIDPQHGHILVYETEHAVVDKIWDMVQSQAGGGSAFGEDDEDPFM